MPSSSDGWIAVDLDGTLAYWGGDYPQDVILIGPPIPRMVERVKKLIAEGRDVRIFTARVGPATWEECIPLLKRIYGQTKFLGDPYQEWIRYQTNLIFDWCEEHLGKALPVTATKDFHMHVLMDDRCQQVESNTGRLLTETLAEATDYAKGAEARVRFLLKSHQLCGPEGYTFPDGEQYDAEQ